MFTATCEVQHSLNTIGYSLCDNHSFQEIDNADLISRWINQSMPRVTTSMHALVDREVKLDLFMLSLKCIHCIAWIKQARQIYIKQHGASHALSML